MSCKKERTLRQMLTISIILILIFTTFYPHNYFCHATKPGDSCDNPIIIGSKADLESLAQDVNEGKSYLGKYISLNDDIIVTDNKAKKEESVIWDSIGNKHENIIFDGTFNGNGHTITFNIKNFNKGSYPSIFGTLGKNASISDLNINGSICSSETDYACVICYLNYGTIKNCNVNTNVTSTGSLATIAVENYGIIKNCSSDGKLYSGSEFCSGVTIKNNGTIHNCSVKTDLKNQDTEKVKTSKISGIAIYNNKQIKECTVVANICNNLSGSFKNDYNDIISNQNISAGIACINYGDINNCSYIGDLSSDIVGGIVAQNNNIINSCGVTANIKGNIVGGIASINSENANIKHCYCLANIGSVYQSGEIVAVNNSNYDFDTCLCDVQITKIER